MGDFSRDRGGVFDIRPSESQARNSSKLTSYRMLSRLLRVCMCVPVHTLDV